jgi:nucleotide-binding universal stress UspA family protein
MRAKVSTGQDDHGHRIVVGVNGSPSSEAALRWAVRQVERTGAKVEAVTVWWYPPGYGLAPVSDDEVADLEGEAGKTLAKALAEVSGLAPDVMVNPRVVEGQAAEVLLQAARGADLLVVGSRGHGGFAASLGSVCQHCVRHAFCPVVVVRGSVPASS